MSYESQPDRRYWSVVTPMPAEQLVAMARMAEDAGVHGLFAPQVYGPAWIPLATVAGVTKRVQLASGIAIASARSPFETATAAIDLDRISNGRFILGLGTSIQAWTEGVYGSTQRKPVTHKTIEDGLLTAKTTGAATAAIPVTDTIKVVADDGRVVETLDRRTLASVQTPQVFRYDLLYAAHEEVIENVTDDASMLEARGVAVEVFMGDRSNIKVTTPDDLVIAEALLAAREQDE